MILSTWTLAFFFMLTNCFISSTLGSFTELFGRTAIMMLMKRPKFEKETERYVNNCTRPDIFKSHLAAIKSFLDDDVYSRDFQMDSEFSSHEEG